MDASAKDTYITLLAPDGLARLNSSLFKQLHQHLNLVCFQFLSRGRFAEAMDMVLKYTSTKVPGNYGALWLPRSMTVNLFC